MKDILQKVTAFEKLSKEEARDVLTNLANGAYNESQMASFITTYLMRSITIDEIAGFREAMLDLCIKVDFSDLDPMDLCGTGGDGKNTFNISTLSSFIVAGAGIPVAKHGNNGVSSVCGSSNLLASLGYNFTNDGSVLRQQLENSSICFLHAPLFHPAMKNVAAVRRDLGVKTFFNMLGPLVNPSFPKKQIIGVFNLKLARVYGYLHQDLDKKYAIIYSSDGYDEISLTSEFKLISNTGEEIITPEELGFEKLAKTDIYGGETVEDASEIFMNVLSGKGTEAQNNVVLANAGIAIKTYLEIGFEEAIARAKESLESGKALTSLKKLLDTKNNPK